MSLTHLQKKQTRIDSEVKKVRFLQFYCTVHQDTQNNADAFCLLYITADSEMTIL